MPGEHEAPGALIASDAVPNLRDVGGYRTADGRQVRLGLLYRSTALGRASDADLESLRRLGIRTVFDLRTAAEREASPDRLPSGASEIDLDVMADSPGATPARIGELSSQPEKASRLLARVDVPAVFATAYRGLVSLPSARASYHELFLALADGAAPALYHCTTGKDRTGWASAALLLLLGVPAQQVVDDYLLSNDYLMTGLKPVLDAFEASGGDPEALRQVLGVDEAYLRAALQELHADYGTIERYFADGLGLDAEVQQRLRDRFLAPVPER